MNVPDELAPNTFGFRETVSIDEDDNDDIVEGENDDIVALGAAAGIPIVLESPILNASPLANTEPKSTLLTFDFKEGCDVHQVNGEIGESFRRFIIRKMCERFHVALRAEVARNAELGSMLSKNPPVVNVHICRIPHEGLHSGQVHIWMAGTILPFYTMLSVMSIVWDSLVENPIAVPSFFDNVEYEAMFSGSGYHFH